MKTCKIIEAVIYKPDQKNPDRKFRLYDLKSGFITKKKDGTKMSYFPDREHAYQFAKNELNYDRVYGRP